jgi:ABC-2 type transport system ATP-binding protein
MMSEPLSFAHIHKSFAAKVVLDDVSFSLKQGEILGLIGLNGAGKTTLVKILLSLLRPDSGEVKLFGQNPAATSARQQLVYLPEKLNPPANLRGREYIKFVLSAYGQKLDMDALSVAARALSFAPEDLPRMIRNYSKGMGQKLGLISAFLTDTPLLVLDEPMSGLDPQARVAVKNAMRSAQKQGRTLFFSSHILADIEEICDRIAILHEGRLLFIGTPQDFMAQHQNQTLEHAFLSIIGAQAVAA